MSEVFCGMKFGAPRRAGSVFPQKCSSSKRQLFPNNVRKKITHLAENQDRVPAYLFIPTARLGKLAAVLCLNQTTRIARPSQLDLEAIRI